jgi:hypothetical protein
VITKMVAELDKARAAECPSTKGGGVADPSPGVAYDLPDRVRELYAPVANDPRLLESPLADVLNGTGGSVFDSALEEPRWFSEPADFDLTDKFSQRPGLRALQEAVFVHALSLVSPPLSVEKRDHRIFMSWLVTVLSTGPDVGETRGSAAPSEWQARIDKALAPNDVMISPWLKDAAVMLRPSSRAGRGREGTRRRSVGRRTSGGGRGGKMARGWSVGRRE